MIAKIAYKPTDIRVYCDDRLIGYISDQHFKNPTWVLYDLEMGTLYTGTSLEDCQNNIQILIDWWEENKNDC
jgi:hypothetical protein